ncbi:MAG: response regulator [Deltaproteobacteria bacterium]|nr:response regulator [Deltaproteobacteria bacterium]MBI5810372.1 response regulator [Deltaproteobacteria bacterium]
MDTAFRKEALTDEKRRGRLWGPISDGRKTVLIVDDEETVGVGLSEILKDAGFNAGYVTSGKDAVDTIKGLNCSLIFMDMMMPGMNGLETYRRIKKANPDIRVVLFTGYFKDVDRAIYEGVREGMIDVSLRKPFFAEEIIETARKYS